MLKSEMQHQFWITKKTVERKLGSKEDDHIISSDAYLDSKIEVFKSILDTSLELGKTIDQYQERLCVLSQEECTFGRFLKEAGKRSKTTSTSISNTGKVVSFSGQQRMCVRVPLLRLQHEVDVFRSQAVRDTHHTIQTMEKERTEYRAALSWIKSASAELDPDTGKGLDKFRTAQSHVREAKQSFDSLSLASIQKIDLLAAARCNMYSHALLLYMNELKQFATKTASAFHAISKSLSQNAKYDFCVLKDLTEDSSGEKVTDVDKDQFQFFGDDYVDEVSQPQPQELDPSSPKDKEKALIELPQSVEDSTADSVHTNSKENNNFWSRIFTNSQNNEISISSLLPSTNNSSKKMESMENTDSKPCTKKPMSSNTWMNLFADLDPLANPEPFKSKSNSTFQQT